MNKFEKKLLNSRIAVLSKDKHMQDYSLSFQFCPFYHAQTLIYSSISFEGLPLPSYNLKDLSGVTLIFDQDECDQFNGCFTINSIHNPVEL